MKKNGYATGAAISAFVMRKQTGIARGFDFYDDDLASRAANQSIGRIQRDGAMTIDVAQRWIGERGTNPFFFFLHLYEPHTPYTPPEPFRSRYASPYDGEIAHVDELLGRFVTFLKERDIYDRALIIFTSDHGEGLSDHGEEEHGIFLYREAIQIPLLVKLPARVRGGTAIPVPVQLIDIVPTIAQLTDTKIAPPDPTATSLIDIPPDLKRKIFSETYHPRFHFGWSELHSLIDDKHHFIRAPRAELYDLAADPKEQTNVAAGQRRVYAAMRNELEPLVKRASAPAHVDPEEASKLAALGYIGSAVTSDDDELPDPKEKISTFGDIKAAFALFHASDYEAALAAFRALLDENPRMLDLWDISARTLTKLGREQEALAAAKEGLRLAPNTTHLQMMVANLALELQQYDDAQQHAELALKAEPGQAREALARVWLGRGDVARAEREAKLALEHDDDRVVPLLTLSRIASHKKDYAAALSYAEEAQATLGRRKRPAIVHLNYLRGDALARLGRFEEAEKALLEEIRLFPGEPQPYKNLILLYVSQGRNEEATRLVFDLTRIAPTPRSYIAVVQALQTVGDEKGARYWTRKARERFPRDSRVRQLSRG